MDRGETNQTAFLVSDLPEVECYFILGTMLDSAGDGLTDAYEGLVSHTDPYNPDTDGDDIPDGWEVALGTDPLVNDAAQSVARANYTYDKAGRLRALLVALLHAAGHTNTAYEFGIMRSR